MLVQTAFSTSENSPNTEGLRLAIERQGGDLTIIETRVESSTYYYCIYVQPLIDTSSLITQSVILFDRIVTENGFYHEGTQLLERPQLSDWSDAVNLSLKHMRMLCENYIDKSLPLDTFEAFFLHLIKQYRESGFDGVYSVEANNAIDDIRVAINDFDDWQIREPQLREIIRIKKELLVC